MTQSIIVLHKDLLPLLVHVSIRGDVVFLQQANSTSVPSLPASEISRLLPVFQSPLLYPRAEQFYTLDPVLIPFALLVQLCVAR